MSVLDAFAAADDWKRARRKLLYQEVVCLIKECSVDLLPFEDVRTALHLRQKFYCGVLEVPLDRIRGSVGRFDDFTAAFLPRKDYMRERWESVDVAMLEGKTPPIDLYKVGEAYFVLDGNHRVSVARQRKLETIEANVWEYKTPVGLSAEADLDEVLIKTEQVAFLDEIDEPDAAAARAIEFSCAGCYHDLADQVELYRQGVEGERGTPLSFGQAFSGWYDEVYLPAIEAIRQNDLLAEFPDRTEADLFIWACQNSGVLEELEVENTSNPG